MCKQGQVVTDFQSALPSQIITSIIDSCRHNSLMTAPLATVNMSHAEAALTQTVWVCGMHKVTGWVR